MSDLHLVKVPLRAEALGGYARRRGIPLRDLDDGYLVHCISRELWPRDAPSPFVLRGRGRIVELWGYARVDDQTLVAEAWRASEDQRRALDDVAAIASRPLPILGRGKLVGFHLRACPVVRLANPRNGHRGGAEVDAFLAASFAVAPDALLNREEVYREWLRKRLAEDSGVRVESIRVSAFQRERLVRRTHAERREARRLERPDVRFEGELVVTDGAMLVQRIARGVGRHRAFGFGALMLAAPGTPYPRD